MTLTDTETDTETNIKPTARARTFHKRIDDQIVVPIWSEDKKRLEAMAEEEGTSRAQLVRTAVKDFLEENGY